jgi:hypothetical protein
MIRIAFVLVALFPVSGFSQVQLALDGPAWSGVKAFDVKGRNGILVKQKLSFGDFFTTSVDRSWTKGKSNFQSAGTSTNGKFKKIISTEYIDRNQTLFFTFEDSLRNKADVHCVTNFHLNDVTVANSGISLVNIFGGAGASSSNLFYVQIYTSPEAPPWHMVVDSEATQESPRSYVTKLARSADEFYLISPYRIVKNNKGKVVEMTFGSAGLQFKNKKGESVAAVSLINKGVVYLKDLPESEKFLLSAACAALLLQEQIAPE